MPEDILIRKLLLPELRYVCTWTRPHTVTIHIETEKVSEFEVCPRCATPSKSVYDHRVVVVTDAPLRDRRVRLHVRKRRFASVILRLFDERVTAHRASFTGLTTTSSSSNDGNACTHGPSTSASMSTSSAEILRSACATSSPSSSTSKADA